MMHFVPRLVNAPNQTMPLLRRSQARCSVPPCESARSLRQICPRSLSGDSPRKASVIPESSWLVSSSGGPDPGNRIGLFSEFDGLEGAGVVRGGPGQALLDTVDFTGNVRGVKAVPVRSHSAARSGAGTQHPVE